MDGAKKVLALDTEITTWNKGHPFDDRNDLVCFSFATSDGRSGAVHTGDGVFLKNLRQLVCWADLLVGFNFKFDYHWFHNLGLDLSDKRILDTQTGYYIYKRQTVRWPSLEEACTEFDLGHKIDVIKTEYWDKGINTDQIPWEILAPYAEQDAKLTLALYEKLWDLMPVPQRKLWSLKGQDLHVLAEMEWNGLKYDKELCARRAEQLQREITDISAQLTGIYPDVPINFNSGDHLSSFLYGGTIIEVVKEHAGFFKTGVRKGEPKFRNKEVEHVLPRLCQPLRGTELKKEGFWATNEPTLKKLKGAKKYIDLILHQTKLDTLMSKYYMGLPKKAAEMNWKPEDILHGSFHQISTATGRLSASDPNLQNSAGAIDDIFITRY